MQSEHASGLDFESSSGSTVIAAAWVRPGGLLGWF